MMNDEQKRRLEISLGGAFDKAATRASHHIEAARMILRDLESLGYQIEHKSRKKPGRPRQEDRGQ
jgi:hypothetical protein